MIKLSIIVPVYNVEKYIRPCIESIFKQGLDETEFEVIIINDGTKDKSMELIDDIIHQHENITIINQENQGLSVARNNGMVQAKGEYIQFVDSDDIVIPNSIPYLLNHALSSKAELVIADFIKMNDEEISTLNASQICQSASTVQSVCGKDMLSIPLYSGYSCVWRTLYNKKFLDKHNLRFIPGIYYEDVPFTYQCYSKAKACLKINWRLIIYRIRQQSIITSSFNKKKGLDYSIVVSELWKLSKNKRLDIQLQQKLKNDTFTFYKVLIDTISLCNNLKNSEKLEIINYLKELAPDLSFRNGTKQSLYTFAIHRIPSTFIYFRRVYAKLKQATSQKFKTN